MKRPKTIEEWVDLILFSVAVGAAWTFLSVIVIMCIKFN